MRKTIYMIFAALTLSVSAFAQQNLRTAYFLDGYTYAYKFNPAFQGERGFLAIPVIGKTGVGVESSLALSSLLGFLVLSCHLALNCFVFGKF